jgi:hypothetical protein
MQREYPTAMESKRPSRQPRSGALTFERLGQRIKQLFLELKDKLVREGRAAVRDEADTKSKTE